MSTLSGARVGRPAPAGVVAGYFVAALACWLLAALAVLDARADLAAGAVWAAPVLLAVHLVALGFLPLAVAGGALHVLPTLLRNDLSRWRGPAALPLLCAGPLLAYAVAHDLGWLLWPAAAAESAGFLLIAWELAALASRAPRGRMLLASRLGVLLSILHAGTAFALGAVLAEREAPSLWGIPHERLIAIHLHLAVIGWLTVLLVTVGRTLGPMLALAPSEPTRRAPGQELALSGGLWLMVAGFAVAARPLLLLGGVLVLAVLVRFAALMARVGREHRLELPEGPLLHFLAGLFFVAQSALLGLGMVLGWELTGRRLVAYVLVLLVGWAAGATLGHLGKLLSLSVWMGWPPGPRPKQAAFYSRRVWMAEAVAFALAVELVVDGVLIGSSRLVLAGGVLLLAAAVAACAGAALTLWSGRLALRRRPAVRATGSTAAS